MHNFVVRCPNWTKQSAMGSYWNELCNNATKSLICNHSITSCSNCHEFHDTTKAPLPSDYEMQIQQTEELQTQNLSLTQQTTTQAQVINQLQNQLAILQQQNQQLQTAALYPTAPNFAALPSTPTFAALPPPPQPAPAENANGTQRRRQENIQRMANTIPGGQQEG
jgi:hypothetical protein